MNFIHACLLATFAFAASTGLSDARAHATAEAASSAPPAAAPAWLSPTPAPLSARYQIRFTPSDASQQQRMADWYFQRDAQRVRLVKDDLEDLWTRDDRGRLSFERTFHTDHRRVYYSAGELLALNVQPQWPALLTFMDSRDLAAMRPVDGQALASDQWRLRGVAVDGTRVDVWWDAGRQLPTRIERQLPKGRMVFELLESHEQAPSAWPLAAYRGADYERLDAADLGDMTYDPFARKVEALDLKAGWREAHAH